MVSPSDRAQHLKLVLLAPSGGGQQYVAAGSLGLDRLLESGAPWHSVSVPVVDEVRPLFGLALAAPQVQKKGCRLPAAGCPTNSACAPGLPCGAGGQARRPGGLHTELPGRRGTTASGAGRAKLSAAPLATRMHPLLCSLC